MLRTNLIALAISIASIHPVLADNFLARWPDGTCLLVSKDSDGTHHETYKTYYGSSMVEKMMKKDTTCRNGAPGHDPSRPDHSR